MSWKFGFSSLGKIFQILLACERAAFPKGLHPVCVMALKKMHEITTTGCKLGTGLSFNEYLYMCQKLAYNRRCIHTEI